MQLLSIVTVTDKDISSPAMLATFTAIDDREIFLQVHLTGLAGDDSYKLCITKQIGGTGAVYQSPTIAMAVSSSTASLLLTSLAIPVSEGDVLKVYAEGLAADLEVDGVVKVFEVGQAAQLSAAAIAVLEALAAGTPSGNVVTDASNSTTAFATDLIGRTDNFVEDAWLLFTSGNLSGEAQPISVYNGTTGVFTVDEAYTDIPADDSDFVVIGRK